MLAQAIYFAFIFLFIILILNLILKTEDQYFRIELVNKLLNVFNNEVKEGLLEMISAPLLFYPKADRKLEPDDVFNDSEQRVKWRTKQNFDISYLMSYCQNKGKYYLQVCRYLYSPIFFQCFAYFNLI